MAFRTAADLVLYVVGSGEYDELNRAACMTAPYVSFCNA